MGRQSPNDLRNLWHFWLEFPGQYQVQVFYWLPGSSNNRGTCHCGDTGDFQSWFSIFSFSSIFIFHSVLEITTLNLNYIYFKILKKVQNWVACLCYNHPLMHRRIKDAFVDWNNLYDYAYLVDTSKDMEDVLPYNKHIPKTNSPHPVIDLNIIYKLLNILYREYVRCGSWRNVVKIWYVICQWDLN